MERVEYWCWRVVSDTTGKPYNTRHKMTEQTATERHPGAVRVPGSMEVRQIPSTDAEVVERAGSIQPAV